MKKMWYGLSISLIGVFLLSAPALAQRERGMGQERSYSRSFMGERILDMDIVARNGEDVGEIQDVIIDRNGKVKEVIVDVGGFLGIGQKSVAISMDDLEFTRRGEARYLGSREDLENRPEIAYDSNRYRYGMRHPGMYGPYHYPYERGYRAPYFDPRYDYPRGYYERDRYMRDMGPGEYENRYFRDRYAYRGDRDRDRYDRYGDREGYRLSGNEVSLDSIVGADVRNRKGDDLGEINDLVIDPRGRVSKVVVGVGGFLGIGEKDVAVPFHELEYVGPYYVMYRGTEEDLKQMPSFDKSKYKRAEKQEKEREKVSQNIEERERERTQPGPTGTSSTQPGQTGTSSTQPGQTGSPSKQ